MLRIDGLVARPLALGQADLVRLPRAILDEPFTCEEGWSVPGLRWAGVRLGNLLTLAEPLPAAGYVRAGSPVQRDRQRWVAVVQGCHKPQRGSVALLAASAVVQAAR